MENKQKLKPKSKEQDKTVEEVKIVEEVEVKEIEESNELDLSRQSKLVPVDKINEWTIHVFGVGSVGSHFVETLAKTGFKNIEVYDMDIVEEENIAAQAFGFNHLQMNKVDAMKDIVKNGAGIDIVTHHGQITEESDITPQPNSVYVAVFDSLEARKLIFEKVKDYPVVFLDGRIGRYDMRTYLTDCSEPNKVNVYAETLDVTGVSDLVCGEKASAPINKIIAGKMVMNLVNFVSDKDYERIYIGNAATPKMSLHIIEEREKEEEIVVAVADTTTEAEENETEPIESSE